MADRLARNKKPCIRPPAHHHILDRRVYDEVPHVRFPSHSHIIVLSSNICDPKKPIEPLQHTSKRIRSPSLGLQSAPRACELERRASRAPAFARGRREMAQRVGRHACGEEHLLEDPRRCLLKSKAAVSHSPVQPAT